MTESTPTTYPQPTIGDTTSTNSSNGSNYDNSTDAAGMSLTPANAADGGREVNRKVLYVGGVDQNINEDMLNELFKVTGTVLSIKILPDKNKRGFNYAFVEYQEEKGAELALQTLNGRILNESEIKINFAYQTQQAIKDSDNYFNIFVGDLSLDVNDETLSKAFANFSTMAEARVMWDMVTGRSRGYGFVSFKSAEDAELALKKMDGEMIGSRAVRCNWAQKNQQPTHHQHRHQPQLPHHPPPPPLPQSHHHHPPPPPQGMGIPNFDLVVHQTPNWQTTVYIGNLSPYTTPNELIPILQNFGYIVDFKHQPEKGYAFVRYDSHERAAMAIVQLTGYQVNGRMLKCGWGKTNQYKY